MSLSNFKRDGHPFKPQPSSKALEAIWKFEDSLSEQQLIARRVVSKAALSQEEIFQQRRRDWLIYIPAQIETDQLDRLADSFDREFPIAAYREGRR